MPVTWSPSSTDFMFSKMVHNFSNIVRQKLMISWWAFQINFVMSVSDALSIWSEKFPTQLMSQTYRNALPISNGGQKNIFHEQD